MRLIFALAALALVACANTHHPEYHPVSVVTYTQTVGASPAVMQPEASGVYVVPAAGPRAEFPAPPQHPTTPPPDWKW